MPRRMVAPTINEVSGVDHPAHLAEGWLVMKSADNSTAALLAEAERVSKSHDTGSTGMEPLSKEARAALPADAVAYIESLEQNSKPTKVKKSERETAAFDEMLKSLPEGVREVIRKQQRETAEARSMAKGLFDAQEDAKYEAFAKSLDHVPGITTKDAPAFRVLAERDPEAWKTVSKALVAAEAACKDTPMFKELGSGHTGTPDSAVGQIEAVAKQLRDEDSSLDATEAFAKAVDQVSKENPDLIRQHRTDTLRANAYAGE